MAHLRVLAWIPAVERAGTRPRSGSDRTPGSSPTHEARDCIFVTTRNQWSRVDETALPIGPDSAPDEHSGARPILEGDHCDVRRPACSREQDMAAVRVDRPVEGDVGDR